MPANEKKTTIVIKKVTVTQAGGHGGSWKVAFADFMTSMMAFFLVMWLVNQSPQVKKNVSEYFSTPSIIEYDYQNFGAELTLKKLFLDLMNDPLKAVQDFIIPADHQPNVLELGMAKVEMSFLENKVGQYAKHMTVTSRQISFEIPAKELFLPQSANPARKYVSIMERIRQIVEGLKDAKIYINSEVPFRSGPWQTYKNIADARLDLLSDKVEQGIINQGVDVFGKSTVLTKPGAQGMVHFVVRMKKKPTVIPPPGASDSNSKSASGAASGTANSDGNSIGNPIYDNFVNQLTQKVQGVDTKSFPR